MSGRETRKRDLVKALTPAASASQTFSSDWCARHERALHAWAVSDFAGGHESERAILDLAFGIYSWCSPGEGERGSDGFGGPNVTWELVGAFRAALNFDLGRLDGGTLDSWIAGLCTRCGLDPDTGAWLSDSPPAPLWADVIAAYEVTARANRPDWSTFIAEAAASPYEVACEVQEHANAMGPMVDNDGDFDALAREVSAWIAGLS